MAGSKYAHCAPSRQKTVAIYRPPKEGRPDELAAYRDTHDFLNITKISMESPSLYQAAVELARLLPFERDLPWIEHTQERFGDPDLVAQLQAYVETRPDPWVHVDRLPKELRRRLLARAGSDDRLSAWYAMPYQEQVENYCKGCPIRPPNEKNCYLRFSSYPGMNDFREGFLLALLYSATIDEERLKEAWFSFTHLDRQKGELPRDKIAQLYATIEDTEVNKGPEQFFNQVVEIIENVVPPGGEHATEEVNTQAAPFVDQFVSAFLYRDRPYTPEEAKKYLPYFETLREIADWAIWDANNAEARHRLINFRERMDTLVTALQYGEKYSLETYISY